MGGKRREEGKKVELPSEQVAERTTWPSKKQRKEDLTRESCSHLPEKYEPFKKPIGSYSSLEISSESNTIKFS